MKRSIAYVKRERKIWEFPYERNTLAGEMPKWVFIYELVTSR
jgi:hypothetical protein